MIKKCRWLALFLLALPTTSEAQAVKTPPKVRRENRLARETSPYLLQHARNPVDWFPWGEEALAKARNENKVIFLSVGYSSCHWCHVMERESFLDEEIAAFLNEHFVSIKVDREERPDIDSIYMTAVQLISGQGGWPMSAFLTPDAKPFFAGTYFPARDGDREAATGFLTVLRKIDAFWRDQPEKLREDGNRVAELIKTELDGRRPRALGRPGTKQLDAVQEALAQEFDEQFGGFGYSKSNPRRPKFPEPSNLFFLLDRVQRASTTDRQREEAKRMLVATLERMAMGGIRDHLGGGFHRYSVDRYWRIPHFEKMLYDNGQLASVYAEAYALTGREDFRRVAVELIEFVCRELRAPEGAFHAALDADSGDEEGQFYRWTRTEIEEALPSDQFDRFAAVYGVAGEPNFEDKFHALQLARPLGELAADRKLKESELDAQLAPLRDKLLTLRGRRERPLTDTKILADWNGLMIRGLADAGRCLREPRYVEAARTAAEFVLTRLRAEDGRLSHSYREGASRLNPYLTDYAFMIDALIALERATGDATWLDRADELMTRQIELFWNEEHGGFYFTPDDHESLLARGNDPVDSAVPSGNSISALNLLHLGRKLGKESYRRKAEATILSVSGVMESLPASTPRMAIAVAESLE